MTIKLLECGRFPNSVLSQLTEESQVDTLQSVVFCVTSLVCSNKLLLELSNPHYLHEVYYYN